MNASNHPRIEIRPLTLRDIPDAMAVHAGMWGPTDVHKVMDEQTLQRQIKSNPNFQLGMFFHDGEGNRTLVAAVHGARFNRNRVVPEAHYNNIRMQADPKGNVVACFAISTYPRRMPSNRPLLRPAIEEYNAPAPAAALIREAKFQALWDGGVTHVHAASTPKDINAKWNLPDDYMASKDEVERYIAEGDQEKSKEDSALHRLHKTLGATVGHIQPDGRPYGGKLGGAGALVWMDYDLNAYDPAELAAWRLVKDAQDLRLQNKKTGQPFTPHVVWGTQGDAQVVDITLPSRNASLSSADFKTKLDALQRRVRSLRPENNPLTYQIESQKPGFIRVRFQAA